MSTSTQLEFTQAMTDFKVMFPDMDAEVIEAVLRANNGAVDITIDHLLAMSADNETKEQDSPPAYTNCPPTYQQATEAGVTDDLINLGASSLPEPPPPPLPAESEKPSEASANELLADFANLGPTSSSESPKKEVKHAYSHPKRQEADEQHYQQQSQSMLPTQQQLYEIYEENLRLREGAEGNSKNQQYLEDERIALMLQNEEFMAELQRDSEFMSALENESALPKSVPTKSSQKLDPEEFRDKLKNMGKTSKKKFAQMANMFSRRKSAAKQFLGQATAPSKDNLLLNAEPLVNEDDSEDEQTTKKDKTPTKGKYTSFS